MTLEVWDESVVAEFTEQGFWDELTLAKAVAANAEARPTAAAFIADDGTTLDWAGYDAQSTQLAGLLVALGLQRGDHIATVMPDGPAVHVAYLAAEKAGLVTVGIGARSGMAEISHVYNKGGALALITGSELRGSEAVDLVHDLRQDGCGILHHIVLEGNGSSFSLAVDGGAVSLETPEDMVDRLAGRAVGPNDLFFINSTSGTTGRPKCVMQTQNKWKYFHRNCRQFDPLDRFLVVVPTPFGFGLWMSHFSPTLLGAPCIQVGEFDVDATVRLLESEAVTVLAAVTTQVIMLLGAERLDDADLSHLRIVQSGGERVVYGKAAEFERRADCRLLQFYGSNEAGCISGTRMDDSIDRRLGTSGRVLPEMHTRLIADDGSLVDWPGEGRCAVRGPAISPGY